MATHAHHGLSETRYATSPTHVSPSASPEAKLFFYRGPARRIPSPTNILSIERRDEEEAGAYAAQPPLRRPTDNRRHSGAARHARAAVDQRGKASLWGDVTTPLEASAARAQREENEGFYFFVPAWTNEEDKALSGSSPPPHRGASSSSRLAKHTPSDAPHTRQHPAAAFHASATTMATSEDSVGEVRGVGQRPSHKESDKERHLRHLLRRLQRHVEQDLQPRLENATAALHEKEKECQQLHADNVILSEQLQRLQNGPRTSPLMNSEKSNDPTFLVPQPFAMPSPVPVAQGEADEVNRVEHRLRESTAEVLLLKRQLAHLQGQYQRLAQHVGEGNVTSPPRAHASPPPPAAAASAAASQGVATASVQSAEHLHATWTELVKVCRAIAEDGLGFSEALVDMHERLSPERSAKNLSGPANPFRAAVEEWGRFAHMLTTTAASPSATTLHNGEEGGTTSPSSPPLLPTTTTTPPLYAWVTHLKALAQTLQTEHGAVAAGMDVAQQSEKRSLDAVGRHQGVVAQVRREAERRIEELEADHEAEVQTLENAIAELEQQVSMTAASRRPWTAGLLIHRKPDAATPSTPANSASRSSFDISSGRRDSAVATRGNGMVEGFDGARRVDPRGGMPTAEHVDADTQTPLSLEWIHACLQRAREEPMRQVRREKEAELVELMSTEIEVLRRQLTDSRAVATRLREAQRRFLGDVTLPLSYFDNFSSFPAYV